MYHNLSARYLFVGLFILSCFISHAQEGNLVEWEDLDNVSITSEGGLVKTSSSNSWDASAIGTTKLSAGQDGWIEFIVDKPPSGTWYRIGFDGGQGYDGQIDFSISVSRSYGVYAMINGSNVDFITSWWSSSQAHLILKIEGGMIRYYDHNSDGTPNLEYETSISTSSDYYIEAEFREGEMPPIMTSIANSPPQPPAITSFKDIAGLNLQVDWDVVSDASSYEIDVATNADFTTFHSGYENLTVSTNTVQVNNTLPATDYWTRVRSVNENGISVNSEVVHLFTEPDDATTIPATDITESSFVANWEIEPHATHYYLNVCTDSDFNNGVSGFSYLETSDTSVVVTGLSGNTQYFYRVQAANITGPSGWSNPNSLTTLPVAPVLNTSGGKGLNTIDLEFTALQTSQFYLDVSSSSDFSDLVIDNQICDYNGSHYTITGLEPSSEYWIRTRATNVTGISQNSMAIMRMTEIDAPEIPIVWNEVDHISIADDNRLYHDGDGQGNIHNDIMMTSQTVIPANVDAWIEFVWDSGDTEHIQIGLQEVGSPTDHFEPRFEINSVWNWTGGPSQDKTLEVRDGIDVPVSFDEEYSGAECKLHRRGEEIDFIVNGVTEWTKTYSSNALEIAVTFREDDDGHAPEIKLFAAQEPVQPIISQFYEGTNSMLTAIWSETFGAVDYTFDVATDSEFTTFHPGYENLFLTSTSIDVSNALPFTEYWVRVRARNDFGVSEISESLMLSTKPDAPSDLVITSVAFQSFNLEWSPVEGATSYKLYISDDIHFSDSLTGYNGLEVFSNSVSVTGIIEDQLLFCKLVSSNDSGDSGDSNVILYRNSNHVESALTIPYEDGWASGALAYSREGIDVTQPQSTCEANAYNQWHYFEPEDDAISIQIAADFYPIKATVWVDQGTGSYTELRCYEDIDDGIIDIVEGGLQIGQKYLLSISSESENAGSYGLTVSTPTEFWSRANGNWDDVQTWSVGEGGELAGRIPGSTDAVHIAGHIVYINDEQESGNITIHVQEGQTSLNLLEVADLTVHGVVHVLSEGGKSGGIDVHPTGRIRCVEP